MVCLGEEPHLNLRLLLQVVLAFAYSAICTKMISLGAEMKQTSMLWSAWKFSLKLPESGVEQV